MSKVTKTILILQSDSWIAAHSGASCCSRSTSSLPSPRTAKHTHPQRPPRPQLWVSPRSWATTLTLSLYPAKRFVLNLIWSWNVPFQLFEEGGLGWSPRELRPLLLFELGTYLCPVLPSKQSAVNPSHWGAQSARISYWHWFEVIATQRILLHCVGQETGGRTGVKKTQKKQEAHLNIWRRSQG